MKNEYKRITVRFMTDAQIKNLYSFVMHIGRKDDIIIKQNRQMTILRRKLNTWSTNGIYIDRNENNYGQEKEFWNTAQNIKNKIPEMVFVVKAHKDVVGIRNIHPKDNTTSYGVSKIISLILEMVTKDEFIKMGYIDTNIYDITKWVKDIDGATDRG